MKPLPRHNQVTKQVIFPFVYVLAPNKSKAIYQGVLQILSQAEGIVYNPEIVITLYEPGFYNSFAKMFPQGTGLQTRYNNDTEVALNLKMLIALAFVLPENMYDAYTELITSPVYRENKAELKQFLKYYKTT
nr:PREDICTED: uncharacterized protein LOC105270324 [Fopius arisanus]